MLVLPLDRHREWYRYHHLLREHLQAELRLEAPDEIPELHSRAAVWHQANDMPEDAIEHARAAGDADLVAGLLLELMSPVWASGRVDTSPGLDAMARGPSLRQALFSRDGPRLLIYALLGRAPEAEHWAEVAERMPVAGTLPDGSTVAGTLAYLRANLAREGMPAMRRDARRRLAGPGSGQPVPLDYGACRGRLPPARGRSRGRGRGPVARLGPGYCVGNMPL